MSRPRTELHNLLKEVTGLKAVYFQAPPNNQMKYPCVVYSLDHMKFKYADNLPYDNTRRYTVTVIDKDPDSDIPDAVATLPMVSFGRKYVADNLHHTTFTIFF